MKNIHTFVASALAGNSFLLRCQSLGFLGFPGRGMGDFRALFLRESTGDDAGGDGTRFRFPFAFSEGWGCDGVEVVASPPISISSSGMAGYESWNKGIKKNGHRTKRLNRKIHVFAAF
jgi:hypothetical protein